MASPAQATPGDPPGPGGGEPTIMAFRRPLDRPALAARPAAAGSGDTPVVLRLPDLARPAGAALPDSESAASTRPWIATALWTVTGVLAVVAVAVLLVGKPTAEPAMDDAPSWQTPPISGPAPSNGGFQAPPLAQPGGTPAGAYPQTQTPSDGQTWNDRGAIGRSFESQPPSGYPASETQPGSGTVQGPAAGGQYLGGGLPATGYSSAGYPSTAPPGGAAPAGARACRCLPRRRTAVGGSAERTGGRRRFFVARDSPPRSDEKPRTAQLPLADSSRRDDGHGPIGWRHRLSRKEAGR